MVSNVARRGGQKTVETNTGEMNLVRERVCGWGVGWGHVELVNLKANITPGREIGSSCSTAATPSKPTVKGEE